MWYWICLCCDICTKWWCDWKITENFKKKIYLIYMIKICEITYFVCSHIYDEWIVHSNVHAHIETLIRDIFPNSIHRLNIYVHNIVLYIYIYIYIWRISYITLFFCVSRSTYYWYYSSSHHHSLIVIRYKSALIVVVYQMEWILLMWIAMWMLLMWMCLLIWYVVFVVHVYVACCFWMRFIATNKKRRIENQVPYNDNNG